MSETAPNRTRRGRRIAAASAALACATVGLIGNAGNAAATTGPTELVQTVADAARPATSSPAGRVEVMTYRKTGLSPREVRRAVGVEQRQCKRSNATVGVFRQQEVDYCSPTTPSTYMLAATVAETGPTHWAVKRDMTTASGGMRILVSSYNRRAQSGRVVSTGQVTVPLPNGDGTTSDKDVTFFVVARYQHRQAVLSLVLIYPGSPGTARQAINRADQATGFLARRYGIR